VDYMWYNKSSNELWWQAEDGTKRMFWKDEDMTDSNTIDWTKPVEYRNIFDEGWENATVLYTDSEGALIDVQWAANAPPTKFYVYTTNVNVRNKPVSRAVPKDKRLDLTKPLEMHNVYQDTVDEVKFIGALREDSQNFMSWFVMHGRYSSSNEGYFLMRGDGKTDIPGVTVRNRVEVKPKLVLPLKVGKKYRTRGQGDIVLSDSDGPDGRCFDGVVIGTGEATAWYYLDGKAWKDREDSWDIVEGPL